jgi:hypothetical protein
VFFGSRRGLSHALSRGSASVASSTDWSGPTWRSSGRFLSQGFLQGPGRRLELCFVRPPASHGSSPVPPSRSRSRRWQRRPQRTCRSKPVQVQTSKSGLLSLSRVRVSPDEIFFHSRPEIRRDYPLNLSISLSGGKETNKDSPSNGE